MSGLLEIKAIYRGERYRFDNFDPTGGPILIGVAQVIDRGNSNGCKIQNGDTVGIKGEIDEDGLADGQTYRMAGRWTEYPNKRTGQKETQFAFNSYVLDAPASRDAVVNYLQTAGKGHGIGHALAQRIWDAWGVDSIAIMRSEPERIREVLPSFSVAKAELISQWLRDRHATEQTTMELGQLLKGRGFPRSTERAAIREWGSRAVQVILRDPFVLMRRFKGCGFKRCDALYMALGLDPSRLRRQMYCAWAAVATASSGDTWVKADHAVLAIQQSIPQPQVLRALKLAKRVHEWLPGRPGGLAVMRTDDAGNVVESGGTLWLAESKKASDESELAALVVEALRDSEPVSITNIGQVSEVVKHVPEFARCARCGRMLTSETIHVLHGKPYGPTCIEYITGAI